MNEFLRPRLTKVVDGTDLGGVTFVVDEDVALLPAGFSSRQARLAAQWVKQLGEAGTFDGVDIDVVVKTLADASKSNVKVQRWYGGGGFAEINTPPAAH